MQYCFYYDVFGGRYRYKNIITVFIIISIIKLFKINEIYFETVIVT